MKETDPTVTAIAPMPDERERLEMALRDIEVFGAWIRSSDTKAGLLAAGLGIITSALFASRLWAENPVRLSSKPVGHLVVLGFLVAALLATFLFLGLTLHPRLKNGRNGRNPFSFPSLCSLSSYRQMNYEQLTDCAWEQKAVLAEICQTKHQMFKRALFAGAATMVLFVLAWTVW